MKALTLTQPWASLVAKGFKRIETRSWGTPFRGPMMIHASREIDRGSLNSFWGFLGQEPPTGALIANCVLYACWQMTDERIESVRRVYGERELDMGCFAPGRWAWELSNVMELPSLIPCRGHLGLWNWSGK